MDSTKAKVARLVQQAILRPTFILNLDLVDEEKQEVTRARAHPVTDLQTRVRVPTSNGPRYFSIQVKEEM